MLESEGRVVTVLAQDTDHFAKTLHRGRSPGSDVARGSSVVPFEAG
ncbi:hypothetical protein NKH18_09280 [Streptomyces sp. M10(2022)]